MIVRETIRLAFASLAANKLRSALTMLGITVGVFSVIGVMTVIGALRGSIETGLNVLGANSFQITKYPAINFSDPRQRFGNRADIVLAQAVRFRELFAEGAEVGLQINRGGRRVFHGDARTNPDVQLVGADEAWLANHGFDVALGRNLGPGDVEFGRAVALVGRDVVDRLFPNTDPLGRGIRIDGKSYAVVGLLAPRGSAFGRSRDNVVLVPVTTWLDTYGRARSMSIDVRAPSQERLAATQDRAVGVMRLVRGLDPEDPNDFEVFSNESLIEAFNAIAGVVAIGAFVVSAIALLASGVGVMNIMLVGVTERTREIGIRKSVGARKGDILVQFLLEAVALSVLGGVAGILVGVVGGNGVATALGGAVAFPWAWALAGLAVCGGIGVGFGLYPAWRAAALDPIEALRHE